ncbi:acyl-CoA dehydrogenase family protein [Limnobacter parvus]|uniref:Acyl-CoA dehydrogenase family protein n=1 Tax=Limnobacter parvus TaxID=2939690 RepID=A0ABT1XJ92_9BURK|nr:acyl-CoA dehydrogenase family protein [Limnobacter parvus]MCR2747224.1 acyl-CoA dehydrogenase family protein [Limnobacter parvus]
MDDFFRSVERFVNEQIKPNVNDWDEAGEFPRELYKQAGDLGLLGLGYPEEVGGFECTLADRLKLSNLVCSAGSGGLLAGLFSHNIGLPPLLNHGSEELIQMIAPAVLKGEAISALAITEPSGGSDVANLKTKAELFQKDGVAHYRINGEKVFITSGVRADWLTVAVRTGEPGARGVSMMMVPGNAKGLTRSPLKKTGWWMSDTASIYFDNVEVPASHLVGKEGKGFRIVMENFNTERLMLAGACVGFSRVCLNEALDWAQNRQTFGKRLLDHQVIAHKLADMRMKIRATEAWFDETIARIDKGEINEELIADICLLKNQSTQTLQHCANEAVQILGGMGFMRGSSTERIYREVKVMCIGGGAEEIMKELAIRQLAW